MYICQNGSFDCKPHSIQLTIHKLFKGFGLLLLFGRGFGFLGSFIQISSHSKVGLILRDSNNRMHFFSALALQWRESAVRNSPQAPPFKLSIIECHAAHSSRCLLVACNTFRAHHRPQDSMELMIALFFFFFSKIDYGSRYATSKWKLQITFIFHSDDARNQS